MLLPRGGVWWWRVHQSDRRRGGGRHRLLPGRGIIATAAAAALLLLFVIAELAVPAAGGDVPNNKKWLFAVTPTHPRAVRQPDMTRLAQTLAHVENVFWVVVEDRENPDRHVIDLLKRKHDELGLKSVYLTCAHDNRERTRGCSARNCGLQWILDRVWPVTNRTLENIELEKETEVARIDGRLSFYRPKSKYKATSIDYSEWKVRPTHGGGGGGDDSHNANEFGVPAGTVFMVDDDNTYDTELLSEMRDRADASAILMNPIGLVTKTALHTGVFDTGSGAFRGFYDGWVAGRTWPVDMSGFAVTLQYMYDVQPQRQHWFFPIATRSGWGESVWLGRFGVPSNQTFVPLSNLCRNIRAWHTRTTAAGLGPAIPIQRSWSQHTNLQDLAKLDNLFMQDKGPPADGFAWEDNRFAPVVLKSRTLAAAEGEEEKEKEKEEENEERDLDPKEGDDDDSDNDDDNDDDDDDDDDEDSNDENKDGHDDDDDKERVETDDGHHPHGAADDDDDDDAHKLTSTTTTPGVRLCPTDGTSATDCISVVNGVTVKHLAVGAHG